MKKVLSLFILLFVSIGISSFSACDPDEIDIEMNTKLKISVGNKVFHAELQENPTTAAFVKMLPLSLNMRELNANEKFIRLNQALPTKASVPESIRKGDLMLYGDDTLVLFYKSFNTTYSYTPMGFISVSEGLEAALGAGNSKVKFEIEQ
jgi:hypothetical protein